MSVWRAGLFSIRMRGSPFDSPACPPASHSARHGPDSTQRCFDRFPRAAAVGRRVVPDRAGAADRSVGAQRLRQDDADANSCGQVQPDHGACVVSAGAKVALLPQEVPHDLHGSVTDVVLHGLPPRTATIRICGKPKQQVERLLSRMNLAGESGSRARSRPA